MPSDIVRQLDPIFKPRSVAIVGASPVKGKWGWRMLERPLKTGFQGKVFPVNPKESEILGHRCYSSVLEIPEKIDLAVVCVVAPLVKQVLRECGKKGIRGAVMITAGFAELGAEGKALQDEVLKVAREEGIRFVGPNGMGIWTSATNFNLCFEPAPIAGPIAFVSQSGTFGSYLGRIANAKGYGLSKFISAGNQADLNAADYLEYLMEDPDTKVIVFYIEGMAQGRRFFELAREAVKRKPLFVFKGGRTAAGAKATLSHTGSMAGSDVLFQAMCKQVGIIMGAEAVHPFDMAEAVATQPLPKGWRVGIMSSGGGGVVLSDNCAALGLSVPDLDEATRMAFREILPPHAPTPRNPIDFAGGGHTGMEMVDVVRKLISLDYIDGVICNIPSSSFHLSMGDGSQASDIEAARVFAQLPKQFAKPIITMRWRGDPDSEVIRIVKAAGIPSYETPEECVRAMFALARYGQTLRELLQA